MNLEETTKMLKDLLDEKKPFGITLQSKGDGLTIKAFELKSEDILNKLLSNNKELK